MFYDPKSITLHSVTRWHHCSNLFHVQWWSYRSRFMWHL